MAITERTELIGKSAHASISFIYNYAIQHQLFRTRPNIWKTEYDNLKLAASAVDWSVSRSTEVREK